MNTRTDIEILHPAELATRRTKMLRVTLVAFSTAVLIFVIAILPAEFGIDPLRTGKSLGLSSLYSEKTNQAGAVLTLESSKYIEHGAEIVLEPGKGIEYKYQLSKGKSMLFSWVATGFLVYDLHGEPTGGKPGYFESHETGVSGEGHGTLIAPFTGTHGWYWENQGIDPVTITLSTAGYYEVVGIKK